MYFERERPLEAAGEADPDDESPWSDREESVDFDYYDNEEDQLDKCRPRPDTDDESCSDHESSSDMPRAEVVENAKHFDAMLLFSDQGHHVRGMRKIAPADFEMELTKRSQYKRIEDAHPIYLIVCSSDGKEAVAFQSIGGSQSVIQRRSACNIAWYVLLPVVSMLVVAYLDPWGLGGYATITFMILPDLVNLFLQNKTLVEKSLLASANETHALLQQEAEHILQRGWSCISDDDRLGARLALSDSAFFMVGCLGLLMVGCYHLQAAAESLDMLKELLHIPEHEDCPDCWAMTMYRFLDIRSRITHRRCLQHIAAHSFPPDSEKDDGTLSWWFRARAAIFADILLILEKRKPILLMFVIGELFLISATAYLAWVHENGFVMMCYATVYGLGLGSIILIFVYLGQCVNDSLNESLEVALNMLPGDEDNEYRRYAETHPYQLRFMGLDFSMVFKALVTPLTTLAAAMGFWMLQHMMGLPSLELESAE